MAARKPNVQHRPSREGERIIPLLVADYCYLAGVNDETSLCTLVARLYPYNVLFCCAVVVKGVDPAITKRLARFLKEAGLIHFAYRSDKGPSIRAMLENACVMTGRKGILVKDDDADVVDDHRCSYTTPGSLEDGDGPGMHQASRRRCQVVGST